MTIKYSLGARKESRSGGGRYECGLRGLIEKQSKEIVRDDPKSLSNVGRLPSSYIPLLHYLHPTAYQQQPGRLSDAMINLIADANNPQ
jgi:hypothetical protein